MDATLIPIWVAIIPCIFSLLTVFANAFINYLRDKRNKKEFNLQTLIEKLDNLTIKLDKVETGLQAALRNDIVTMHNKYMAKGYCPIYAKETISRAYVAYHDLGGNDVATSLYNEVMDLKCDPDINVHEANEPNRINM